MSSVATVQLTGSELEAATAFIYQEAELLDQRRYGEWADLFTEDGIYWLPSTRIGGDPQREVSIVYDDRTRIGERISRLQSGDAFAQVPESETCRLVGNVLAAREGDAVRVTATEIVVEFRRERQTTYAGRYEFELVDGPESWRIRSKVVRLVNAGSALGNLSIIL